MQSDLDAVALWLRSSQLCLNVVKSNSMLIGSCQRIANKTLNVSVGGTVLNRATSVRYLGVIIDPTLSWSSHIFNVVSLELDLAIIHYGSSLPMVLCVLYSAL